MIVVVKPNSWQAMFESSEAHPDDIVESCVLVRKGKRQRIR